MKTRKSNSASVALPVETMPVFEHMSEDVRVVIDRPRQIFDGAAYSNLFVKLAKQLTRQAARGDIAKLAEHEAIIWMIE